MEEVSVDADTPSRLQHDPSEVLVDHQVQASPEVVASAEADSGAVSAEEEAAEASTVVVDSIVVEAVSVEAMAEAATEVGTAAAIVGSATVVGFQKVRLLDHAVVEADLETEAAAAADMEAATMVTLHEMTEAHHVRVEDTEIATANATATASDLTKAATMNHDKDEDTENRSRVCCMVVYPFSLGNMYHYSFIRFTTTVSVSCRLSRDVRLA